MKLYFCEKPSQAMDIAKVLGLVSRGDGFLTVKGGDIVSWAVGHVLKTANPDEYTPDWKRWDLSVLPMIPEKWILTVNDKTKKQFFVLKKLIGTATEIVICTDAGREGELIAREVIYYCGYKGKISRFWTSSLTEKDIKKALTSLKPDAETKPLYVAAIMRQRSDWIVGMSGTRCASLIFNQKDQTYNFGRVQTPTLSLVVKKDREIDGFVKEDFFKIVATVKTPRGDTFEMLHAPSDKIKTEAEANRRVALAQNYDGPIKVVKTAEVSKPSLVHSLPDLQREANAKFKISSAETLKIAQSLYEKKYITYPRSDCRYLAESQESEIRETLSAISTVHRSAVETLTTQGIEVRKSLFDDSQLTDHPGITPTMMPPVDMSPEEKKLYALIAQRYLQAIAKDCKFNKTVAELDANGVLFKASGKEVTFQGWTAINLFS